MFGMYISTVAGTLMTTCSSGSRSSASITAAEISTAYSGSVPVKDSGEYS